MPHHRVFAPLSAAIVALATTACLAQQPPHLTMEPQDTIVYALPTPATTDEGANTGGVNIDMRVNYLSDYLYRGVDRTHFIDTNTVAPFAANAHAKAGRTLARGPDPLKVRP